MITLISSLYKPERYLEDYLKHISEFPKEMSGFELIIISNDTSDRTKDKLDKFIDKNNAASWFRVFNVPRESLYASWNRGVELAKNDIIGFWNVDDIRYPEAIIDAARLVKENGADLVYFPFIIKWYLNFFGLPFLVKWKKIISPVFDKREFTRSMHCGPFFIFTKSLYEKVGPFDEQFKIVGDFDWCIRAAKISDKFSRSDKIAGVFGRYYGSNLSGGNNKHIAENNVVYFRHGTPNIIQPVDADLAAEYDPSRIFFRGTNIAI